MTRIFVGRQPIFDVQLELCGYELLFRTPDGDGAMVSDHDAATSAVVAGAFGEMGLDAVVGERRAWINVSRDFLVRQLALTLPAERVVLELLEDQEVDASLLAALDDYRERGYAIALDDFTWREERAPLLEHVDAVKVDLLGRSAEEVARDVERLAPYGVRLLAEKVETRAEYELCASLGFDMFQGYFFCRPETMKARPRATALQRLATLHAPQPGTGALEEQIASDVGLSYRLLRLVNSPRFGLKCEVASVRRALELIGAQGLRRWATVALLAGIDGQPEALLETALVRARFCELAGEGDCDELFAVGLFSVADAMLATPMPEVLEAMPFSPGVRAALASRAGPHGTLLDAALACERGQFGALDGALAHAYVEALAWATTASRELSGRQVTALAA